MIKYTIWLLALMMLGGCASSSAVRSMNSIPAGKSYSLDFILVETSSSVGDLTAEKRELSEVIISDLNDTGLFKKSSGDRAELDSNSGIKIRADITEIKKVSDTARTWVGVWAGRAKIVASVTVTDLASGEQIETFEVEGESGKSAWAGTTDEAIHLAAVRIVAEMVKLNARTGE